MSIVKLTRFETSRTVLRISDVSINKIREAIKESCTLDGCNSWVQCVEQTGEYM